MSGKKRIWDFIHRFVLLRNRPLMTKLLVYSALLVIVPLMLVGLVSYKQSSEALERETKQYSLLILEQVKLYVEDYFKDFEINTLKILNHPDTVAFLKMKTVEQTEDREIVKAARNVLKNSAYSRSDVTNITIVLDHVEVIDSADMENESTVSRFEGEAWMKLLPNNGEPLIISRIIPWKDRNEPVISIVKRIVNPSTLKPFGLLVIDVNHKRLQDVAHKVRPGNSGFMYILDDQGHYVYHPDFALIGRAADPGAVSAMMKTDSGSVVTDADGSSLLTFSRSDRLQWQLVTSIAYDELMQGTDYIGKIILLTTVVFMCIAGLLGFGFVTSLVTPIKQLHQYMKRVEVGDFSSKVKVESTDEIGMLAHGFNKMVDRLSKLLEEIYFTKLKQTEMELRQKDTELRMLQAQINPHFLYNALDTIRGMALQQDIEEISDMAASLARLLRYNVKEGISTVSVAQELEIASTYLRIQRFRFDEKLEYAFDIPEQLLDQKMNKFTLQPIIENCIVHGLEPHSGTMKIEISAKQINAHSFQITVMDSGPGIPTEKLKKLSEELGVTDSDGLPSEKLDLKDSNEVHIGIMNVHRRIRFTYGEGYGIRLGCAEEGKTDYCGAVVYIRLPMMEGALDV
jgi:two-component system sensor histidine kinase YesM